MSLADALVAKGEETIVQLQTTQGGQEEVRQTYRELMALGTQGIATFTRSSGDMRDFAEVIDGYRKDLRPWIMVYPAALGLIGLWEGVLMLWSYTEIPKSGGDPIAKPVRDLLVGSFTGYARLISI